MFRIITKKPEKDGTSWEKVFFRKDLRLDTEEGNRDLSITKYNVKLSLSAKNVKFLIEELTGLELEINNFTFKQKKILGYHKETPPKNALTHVKELAGLLENFIAYEVGICVYEHFDLKDVNSSAHNIELKFRQKSSSMENNILCLNLHLEPEDKDCLDWRAELNKIWKKFIDACDTREAEKLFYSTTNDIKALSSKRGLYRIQGGPCYYNKYLKNRDKFSPEKPLEVKPLIAPPRPSISVEATVREVDRLLFFSSSSSVAVNYAVNRAEEAWLDTLFSKSSVFSPALESIYNSSMPSLKSVASPIHFAGEEEWVNGLFSKSSVFLPISESICNSSISAISHSLKYSSPIDD